MLAKGPACTKQGWPSTVCIRVGLMEGSIQAIMALPTSRSPVVIGFALLVVGHDDFVQPFFEVRQAVEDGQDGHDFRGHRDAELGLAHEAVHLAAAGR